MALKGFEFYHGAVITKILRKDISVTLTPIETDTDKLWSAYKIADGLSDRVIYMKHCASLKEKEVYKKHTVWIFSFTPEHLKELSRYKNTDLYLASICVDKNLQFESVEPYLLNKEEILETIDIGSNTSQTISVFCELRKILRVRGSSTNKGG